MKIVFRTSHDLGAEEQHRRICHRYCEKDIQQEHGWLFVPVIQVTGFLTAGGLRICVTDKHDWATADLACAPTVHGSRRENIGPVTYGMLLIFLATAIKLNPTGSGSLPSSSLSEAKIEPRAELNGGNLRYLARSLSKTFVANIRHSAASTKRIAFR